METVGSFAPAAAASTITLFAALSASATIGNANTALLGAEIPALFIYIHTNSRVSSEIAPRSGVVYIGALVALT